jgi:hypothetical protein
MSIDEIYINADGYTYIRAELAESAREIESFNLLIRIAEEKIAAIRARSQKLPHDDEAEEHATDEINDIKMAIDDLGVHIDRLTNIPRQHSS